MDTVLCPVCGAIVYCTSRLSPIYDERYDETVSCPTCGTVLDRLAALKELRCSGCSGLTALPELPAER